MANHKVLSTDNDIERALAQSASAPDEPIVCEVLLENLKGEPSLILKMSDGSIHGIPKSKLEGLADATNEVTSNVEITEDGLGLRWPDLDLDLYVPSLLQGVYGTKAWMSSLGRLGGSVRSEAKSNAARLNGLKGGRPRKRAGKRDSQSHLSSGQQEPQESGRRLRMDPFWSGSSRRQAQYSRADYALLFGLAPSAIARPLPRIA